MASSTDRGPSARTLTVISVIAIFCIWQVLSVVAGTNQGGQHNVPSIIDVADSLKKLGYYWKGGLGVESTETGGALTWAGAALSFVYNSALTLMRMFAGLALGTIVGVGAAVAISWSSVMRRMFALPAHIARMLPMLAMLPLFALWFGSSETGAILFVGFATFVLIFALTLNAIDGIPPHYAQSARSLGASPLRTYLSVVVPSALPQLRSAFLLALGFAWSAVIAAEFLGQQHGLGQITNLAQFYGQTDILALVAAIVVAFAALSYVVARWALKYLTRWTG
jgi:sulfonate transport system permease protein